MQDNKVSVAIYFYKDSESNSYENLHHFLIAFSEVYPSNENKVIIVTAKKDIFPEIVRGNVILYVSNNKKAQVLNELYIKHEDLFTENVLIWESDIDIDIEDIKTLSSTLQLNYQHGIVCLSYNLENLTIKEDHREEFHVVVHPSCWCVLISKFVVRNFWDFDDSFDSDIYSLIDFSLKTNSYGFSSVVAYNTINKANSMQENQNDEIKMLLKYPYLNYIDSKQRKYGLQANTAQMKMLGFENRKHSILFCLHYLRNYRNGTSVYAITLLKHFYNKYKGKYAIKVLINEEQVDFFDLRETFGEFIITPDQIDTISEKFDIAFFPRQILDMDELLLVNNLYRKLVITVLDVIGVRCMYINYKSATSDMINTFELSMTLADSLISISDSAKNDIVTFFPHICGLSDKIFPVRLAAEHYIKSTDSEAENDKLTLPENYVFITGNEYKHKALIDTIDRIIESKIDRNFIVLGLSKDSKYSNISNIIFIKSGQLNPEELNNVYVNADFIIFPSFYEGYGLPVIESISMGKYVIANNTPINREIKQNDLGKNSDKLILFNDLNHLIKIIKEFKPERISNQEMNDDNSIRGWKSVASEVEKIFETIIKKDIDLDRMITRNIILELLMKKNINQEIKSNQNLIKELYISSQCNSLLGSLKKWLVSISKSMYYSGYLIKIDKNKILKIYNFEDPFLKFCVDSVNITNNLIIIEGWVFHFIQKKIKVIVFVNGRQVCESDKYNIREDVYNHFNKYPNALKSGFQLKSVQIPKVTDIKYIDIFFVSESSVSMVKQKV